MAKSHLILKISFILCTIMFGTLSQDTTEQVPENWNELLT